MKCSGIFLIMIVTGYFLEYIHSHVCFIEKYNTDNYSVIEKSWMILILIVRPASHKKGP